MKRVLPFIATFAALFCAWPSKTSRASACSDFVSASGNLAKNNPGGGPWVTPQCYGAVGNGSVNDTTAINNALNSGFGVVIPCATYNNTGLTLTVSHVVISGQGACSVLRNTTNGKSFDFSSLSDVTLQNFALSRTVMSADTALYSQHLSRALIEGVSIESSNELDCLTLDGFSEVTVSVKLTSCTRDGLKVYDGTAFGGAELYCTPDTLIKFVGNDGIVIAGSVGGIRIDCHSILNTRYGLRVDKSVSGTANREIFINPNADFDENATNVFLDTNSFSTFDVVGSWSSSATTGNGYTIAAQTGNINFNGLRCINNNVDCVSLTGAVAQFGWRGGMITGNGQPSGAGYAITGTNPTLSCAGGNLYTANKTGDENVTLTHYNNTAC